MRNAWLLAAVTALARVGPSGLEAGGTAASIALSRSSLNPSVGENVSISVKQLGSAPLALSLVDRDGTTIRRLTDSKRAGDGVTFIWDGQDEKGAIVPDEAYTIRLETSGPNPRVLYDPAKGFTQTMEEGRSTYSRANGVLNYTLKRPSRVHLQAGAAARDPKTGEMEGPVLKTVVDHLPRAAGSIAEVWNGYDESGTVYIPDLPNFVVGIMATALPENAIITFGNRKETFAEYAARTRPAAAQRPRVFQPVSATYRAHHQGLTALEDRSPKLEIKLPAPGSPAAQMTWKRGTDLPVTLRLGEGSEYFLCQPTGITVFLDEKTILDVAKPKHPAELVLKTGTWSPGGHRLEVNWGSQMGPVAVNAVKLTVVE